MGAISSALRGRVSSAVVAALVSVAAIQVAAAPEVLIDNFGQVDATYYRGAQPDAFRSGSPWPEANFEIVRQTTEIFPGFFVLTTVSQKPGTRDMNEVSLAIRTPEGLAVVVGCSHPGVEKILENATAIDPQLYTVTGGFHLVVTPAQDVRQVATTLYDKLKIKR